MVQVADINDVLKRYILMRRKGTKPSEAVNRLRHEIEGMEQSSEAQLIEQIRAFEQFLKERQAEAVAAGESQKTATTETYPVKPVESVASAIPEGRAVICESCGTVNWDEDTHCRRCGRAIAESTRRGFTTMLSFRPPAQTNAYTSNMTLSIRLPQFGEVFELRPQDFNSDLIIGRYDTESDTAPDIDLKHWNAANLGVSRRHMALRYNSEQQQIIIKDLGSRNGIFQNGYRLAHHEECILQNGDQIELGRMILFAMFVYA